MSPGVVVHDGHLVLVHDLVADGWREQVLVGLVPLLDVVVCEEFALPRALEGTPKGRRQAKPAEAGHRGLRVGTHCHHGTAGGSSPVPFARRSLDLTHSPKHDLRACIQSIQHVHVVHA